MQNRTFPVLLLTLNNTAQLVGVWGMVHDLKSGLVTVLKDETQNLGSRECLLGCKLLLGTGWVKFLINVWSDMLKLSRFKY